MGINLNILWIISVSPSPNQLIETLIEPIAVPPSSAGGHY